MLIEQTAMRYEPNEQADDGPKSEPPALTREQVAAAQGASMLRSLPTVEVALVTPDAARELLGDASVVPPDDVRREAAKLRAGVPTTHEGVARYEGGTAFAGKAKLAAIVNENAPAWVAVWTYPASASHRTFATTLAELGSRDYAQAASVVNAALGGIVSGVHLTDAEKLAFYFAHARIVEASCSVARKLGTVVAGAFVRAHTLGMPADEWLGRLDALAFEGPDDPLRHLLDRLLVVKGREDRVALQRYALTVAAIRALEAGRGVGSLSPAAGPFFREGAL